MPVAAWVTVFGVVVGAAVALSVAYLQRKQMRQIELHRADPSVPLLPPPHGVTLFLKRNFWYWYCLAFGGFDLWVLVKDLSSTAPLTRRAVFDIALDVSGVSFMMLLAMLTALTRQVERAAEITSKMLDVLIGVGEKVKEIEKQPKVGGDPGGT